MSLPTLLNTRHPLADTATQREMLDALPLARGFGEALERAGHSPLRAMAVSILQINVGKRCNQTCRHCHVDAGPVRTEVMPPAVDACLRFLEASDIPTIDITGGAPELHPAFRDIVRRAREMGRHVMDRCNRTITRLPNYQDLPEFLAGIAWKSWPRCPRSRPVRPMRNAGRVSSTIRSPRCAGSTSLATAPRLGSRPEPGHQSGRRIPAGATSVPRGGLEA
jgi:hypothetical protein